MIGLASVLHEGTARVGVVSDDEVVLLPNAKGGTVSLIEMGAEGLAAIKQGLVSVGRHRVPLSSVRLLAPIDRFRRDVLCTGWNYWDHFEEGVGKREGQDVPRPKAPTFFTKSPDVVIGPNDDIAYDARISAKWDYEAELVVVIGKDGRSIPASQAMEHIWGYCLANDVSQRDLQRRHGGQWLKGKTIDGTMPLGPWIVPAGEIDLASIRLQCIVNGETRQDASVRQMAFSVPELIAELSFGMTLRAGDVLLTGTPAGVGNARQPPLFLKAGDEVIVRGSGLGELRNRIAAKDLYGASNIVIAEGVA